MLKRMLSLATACLLISSTCTAPRAASAQARDGQELARKIKAKVEKIGSGPKARVEVKLVDGDRVKGYISEVREDHFVVADKKTGGVTTIAYAQAKQVKTPEEISFKDRETLVGLIAGVAVLVFTVWARDKE
jgi:hypothetical protein